MATTIEFPASIGAPSYPLNESFQDNVIRTTMEDGTIKQRPRTTRSRRSFEVRWANMPNTEKEVLESFYASDLKGGALSFIWKHPLSKKSYVVQFTEPYTAEASTMDYWTISVKLKEV